MNCNRYLQIGIDISEHQLLRLTISDTTAVVILKGFIFVNEQNVTFLGIYFHEFDQNSPNSQKYVLWKFLPLKYCFLKSFVPCNSSYVKQLPNCFVTLNKQGGHYLRGKKLREENLVEKKSENTLVSNLASTSFAVTFMLS